MSGIRWYLPFFRPKNFVRIVRLQGNINANSRGARALNFRKVEKSLEEAFDTKRGKPRAVCLEINSMGGSAVQSNLIYQRGGGGGGRWEGLGVGEGGGGASKRHYEQNPANPIFDL